MRITVDPTACFASGLSMRPWENQCGTIEINDTPIACGGHGQIYHVSRIDGQSVSDLLVKAFHQGFPPNLRDIVSAVREHKARYGIEKCTALRALPLFLFTGTLRGAPLHGYVMRRVTSKPLSQLLEEDINAYINLPLDARLALCRQFVEGMHILYSLTIVHGDLNGQNLMVDMAKHTLAILDLDGGAVARNGTAPGVIGTLEPGWLAPEIMAKLTVTTARQQIKVDIKSDLWAVACGVHHLLFGLAPFFFIAQQPQIARYLGNYAWPQLRGLHGIVTHNAHAFNYYERAYQRNPVRRLMECAFQKGYLDPAQRPTAFHWLQELGAGSPAWGRGAHSMRVGDRSHTRAGTGGPGVGWARKVLLKFLSFWPLYWVSTHRVTPAPEPPETRPG